MHAAAALCFTAGCGVANGPAPLEVYAPVTSEPIVAGSTHVPAAFAATGALLIATRQGLGPVHTRLCTATLIAAQYVVTAAHCRPESAVLGLWQDGVPTDALFDAAVDLHSGQKPALRGSRRQTTKRQVWYNFCLLDVVDAQAGLSQNASPQCTPGAGFEVHPRYRLVDPFETGLVDAYDVGVLRLARPVCHVEPAVMLSQAACADQLAGQPVSIVGYGSTSDYAAQGPQAQASGIKRFARSQIGQLSAAEMTVGEPPCPAHKSFGDSGGPSFVQTPEGLRLAGVTSRLLAETDAARGTVDTRLDAVVEWILDVAGGVDAAVGADERACDSGESNWR